jgi:hypothetical protein
MVGEMVVLSDVESKKSDDYDSDLSFVSTYLDKRDDGMAVVWGAYNVQHYGTVFRTRPTHSVRDILQSQMRLLRVICGRHFPHMGQLTVMRGFRFETYKISEHWLSYPCFSADGLTVGVVSENKVFVIDL